MPLTSIVYDDTFPVRVEEYMFGILIPAFPQHLAASICWITILLTSIGYGDTFLVRFKVYISGILITAFPRCLCRLHMLEHHVTHVHWLWRHLPCAL